jgi:hypothetical protein
VNKIGRISVVFTYSFDFRECWLGFGLVDVGAILRDRPAFASIFYALGSHGGLPLQNLLETDVMTDPQPEPLSNTSSIRKRGRKVCRATDEDIKRLFQAIQLKEEAIPGDLAQELGWARSTLAYNLGKLQDQKKIVRMGGGRSIRYRVATQEEKDAMWAAARKAVNHPEPGLFFPPEPGGDEGG